MADIESSLQNEPEFVGESREAGERLLIIKPLSVVYKIDHRRRVVHIIRARSPPRYGLDTHQDSTSHVQKNFAPPRRRR